MAGDLKDQTRIGLLLHHAVEIPFTEIAVAGVIVFGNIRRKIVIAAVVLDGLRITALHCIQLREGSAFPVFICRLCKPLKPKRIIVNRESGDLFRLKIKTFETNILVRSVIIKIQILYAVIQIVLVVMIRIPIVPAVFAVAKLMHPEIL